MKFKPVKSSLLIILTILGMMITFLGPISKTPAIPNANAVPPNNPATIGIFSEATKSNIVLSGASGTNFQIDVNVTDAGPIGAMDMNITFSSTALGLLTGSSSAYNNLGGPAHTPTLSCPGSDRVVVGSPTTGAALKTDTKIRYVDSLGLNYWVPDSRDSVIYDTNANGQYNTGEPVIFGLTPANAALVKTDSVLKFVDANANNAWDAGEAVVLDPNNDNIYDTVARCVFDRVKTGLFTNATSTGTFATNCNSCTSYRLAVLDQDTIFASVNGNGILFRLTFVVKAANVFSTIHISTKTSGISNPANLPYSPVHGYFDNRGASAVSFGVSTTTPTLTVTRPVSGTQTATSSISLSTVSGTVFPSSVNLAALSLPYYVSQFYNPSTCAAACSSTLTITVTGGPAGRPPDSLIYDTDNSGTYNTGDVVITGATPATGTSLKSDPLTKFVDVNANAAWNSGETVIYDKDSSGTYTAGDVVAVATTPPTGTLTLTSDAKIKYVDTDSNNIWTPGTAPSGTYFVPISGNTTSNGVRITWMKLVIQPPAAPNFAFTVTPTSFTQEAGNWTKLNVSVTLTSGANDSIALGNNCIYRLQGGSCTFTPNQGSFPLTSIMNVTTNAVTATTGVYKFNATATTQGTYSEVVITKTITVTLTVTRTHDIAVQGVGLADKNFGYTSVLLAPAACGTISCGGSLKTDPKLKYVDQNNNNVWDCLTLSNCEAVVYDTNNDNLFGFGDPVISGPTCTSCPSGVTVNQPLKTDATIKFVDGTGNSGTGNNVWDSQEFVVSDKDNSNTFSTGDLVLGGPGLLQVTLTFSNLGTSPETFVGNSTARVVLSSTDCRLNFVDANSNHIYNAGEVVVIDSDCNGRDGSGTLDSRMRYIDANANNHWDVGETVIIDSDSSGTYDTTGFLLDKPIANSPSFDQTILLDSTIKFVDTNANGVWTVGEPVVYDTNGNGVYDTGETVIAGTPTVGATLSFDSQIKFADTNGNGLWNAGEPVAYDANNNGIYDPDFALSGTPPANGTAVKFDSKLVYVDTSLNNVWDPGETVFYDAVPVTPNGVYDTGDTLIVGTAPAPEAVLVGTPPPIGTLLSDQHFSYPDTNFNSVWDAGEFTFYDANSNNVFDSGDTAIAGLIPTTCCAGLKTDAKVKFFDAINSVWVPGDPVIYDSNSNNIYDGVDSVIHGPTPTLGSALKSDAKIKYVDTNGSGVLDVSESLVWDNGAQTSQNNGLYDSGELVAAGGPVSGGIKMCCNPDKSVTVPAGATMVVTLFADPALVDLARGKYVIGGFATPVTGGCPGNPCEFNIGNNGALIIGFTEKLRGDVVRSGAPIFIPSEGDCTVDGVDFSFVGARLFKPYGDARYLPQADLNNDGLIDVADLSIVGGSFLRTC